MSADGLGECVLYSCVSSLGISSSSPGLFTRPSPRFKSKLHQLSPSEQHHRRDQFQGVLQTCVCEHLDISTLQKKFNDLVGKYGAWRQAHCGYRRYFSSQGRCIAAVLLCTGGGLLSLVNIKSTHPPLLLYDTLVTGMPPYSMPPNKYLGAVTSCHQVRTPATGFRNVKKEKKSKKKRNIARITPCSQVSVIVMY